MMKPLFLFLLSTYLFIAVPVSAESTAKQNQNEILKYIHLSDDWEDVHNLFAYIEISIDKNGKPIKMEVLGSHPHLAEEIKEQLSLQTFANLTPESTYRFTVNFEFR